MATSSSKKNKDSKLILKSLVNVESKVNEIFATTKVTQKIRNETNNPIELEIFIYKYLDNIMFSSFYAKVGNSLEARSKVIKIEKAEEKYNDSISSGNTSIYTELNKYDKNKIIVHIGNLPPKEELTFISEYFQFIESLNNSYEYELFKNLPLLGEYYKEEIEDQIINGTVEIKIKNKIKKLDKKFISKKLIINEEKYIENNSKFILKYKYAPGKGESNQSNKIYFEIENYSYPIIFYQNSSKNNKENSLVLNYTLTEKEKLIPSLFIILVDQGDSMAGYPMKIVSQALLLFLQSLPVGSYYQIIGYGSNYKVYNEYPNEYNQKNIEESIKLIEALEGNLGCTNNLYEPLNYIYNSSKNYEKLLLPRKIFLLSNGKIDNQDKILSLIEKYNNNYSVYSFAITDKDFVEKAAIVGKGGYSLYQNLEGLDMAIVSILNNICSSSYNNLKILSSLDKLNLYEINKTEKNLIPNKIYRYYYVIEDKLPKENIKFTVEYTKNKKKYFKNYEIEPIELPYGEELSKLIIYEYIKNKIDLSKEEKIKLALKYQLLIEGTSLFTEVESSKKIIGKLEHKDIKLENKNYSEKDLEKQKLSKEIDKMEREIYDLEEKIEESRNEAKEKLKNGDTEGAKRLIFKHIKYIENIERLEIQLDYKMANKEEPKMSMLESIQDMRNPLEVEMDDEIRKFFSDFPDEETEEKISDLIEELDEEIYNEEKCGPKKEKKENLKYEEEEEDLVKFLILDPEQRLKLKLKEKESIMNIIKCQNFLEGFWDINNETKIIRDKYKNEFKLLKELKEKNIDDIVEMTIIIIYFINKEHPNLLKELAMILKKAKLYIQDKVGDSYENVIKKAGIRYY